MTEIRYSELTDIGRLITESRTDAGMTMTDLSEASGVSISAISRYEDGSRKPSAEILSRLLTALGKEVVIRKAN